MTHTLAIITLVIVQLTVPVLTADYTNKTKFGDWGPCPATCGFPGMYKMSRKGYKCTNANCSRRSKRIQFKTCATKRCPITCPLPEDPHGSWESAACLPSGVEVNITCHLTCDPDYSASPANVTAVCEKDGRSLTTGKFSPDPLPVCTSGAFKPPENLFANYHMYGTVDLIDTSTKTVYRTVNQEEISMMAVDWSINTMFFGYRTAVRKANGGLLYYNLGIAKANVTENSVSEIVTQSQESTHELRAIDVDTKNQIIYYAIYTNQIRRVAYDGTAVTPELNFIPPCGSRGENCVYSMAVDPDRERFYYINWEQEMIWSCSYNGQSCEELTRPYMEWRTDLHLDIQGSGLLLWCGRNYTTSPRRGFVYSYNLDTQEVKQLVNVLDMQPKGITTRGSTIYIKDAQGCDMMGPECKLYSAPITGGNVVEVEGIKIDGEGWGLE